MWVSYSTQIYLGLLQKKYQIDSKEDRNPMNNMHGGRIATLLDISTSKKKIMKKNNEKNNEKSIKF